MVIANLQKYQSRIVSQAKTAALKLGEFNQTIPQKQPQSTPSIPNKQTDSKVKPRHDSNPNEISDTQNIGKPSNVPQKVLAAVKAARLNTDEAIRLRQKMDVLAGKVKSDASLSPRQLKEIKAEMEDLSGAIDVLAKLNQSLWGQLDNLASKTKTPPPGLKELDKYKEQVNIQAQKAARRLVEINQPSARTNNQPTSVGQKGRIPTRTYGSRETSQIGDPPIENSTELKVQRSVEAAVRSARMNTEEATRLRRRLEQLAIEARDKSGSPTQVRKIKAEMDDISETIKVMEKLNYALWGQVDKLSGKTGKLHNALQELHQFKNKVSTQAKMATEIMVEKPSGPVKQRAKTSTARKSGGVSIQIKADSTQVAERKISQADAVGKSRPSEDSLSWDYNSE